jgi:3-isopropylmalate/(R)-2-methylmalate dehydratase small subunit
MMEKFTVLTGVAAPMLMTNINTDLIAPSLMPGRTPEEAAMLPLKAKLFANLRYDKEGTPQPDFVLDQPGYRDASVLLAGPNFGCGSSRETAVWALMEAGIRCVIAPSFGDIFHDNAFQNGLLPIHLEMADIERIAAALERSNASTVTVDLERCVIEGPGLEPIRFTLADNRRLPLLEGLDQLGFMLRSADEIIAFESRDAAERPWAYGSVS